MHDPAPIDAMSAISAIIHDQIRELQSIMSLIGAGSVSEDFLIFGDQLAPQGSRFSDFDGDSLDVGDRCAGRPFSGFFLSDEQEILVCDHGGDATITQAASQVSENIISLYTACAEEAVEGTLCVSIDVANKAFVTVNDGPKWFLPAPKHDHNALIAQGGAA